LKLLSINQNNKQFQGDELSRGKQAPIITSILKLETSKNNKRFQRDKFILLVIRYHSALATTHTALIADY